MDFTTCIHNCLVVVIIVSGVMCKSWPIRRGSEYCYSLAIIPFIGGPGYPRDLLCGPQLRFGTSLCWSICTEKRLAVPGRTAQYG